MSAVYLAAAIAVTIVAAWGLLSRKERQAYPGLVFVTAIGAALLWVAYGVTVA